MYPRAHTTRGLPPNPLRVAALALFANVAAGVCTFFAVRGSVIAIGGTSVAVLTSALLARKLLGRGAPREAAYAYVAMLPIHALAAFRAAKLDLWNLGSHHPSTIHALSMSLGIASAAGAAAITLATLRKLGNREAIPQSKGIALLGIVAIALTGAAALGAARLATKPDLDGYRVRFIDHALVEGVAETELCSVRSPCARTLFADGEVELKRECDAPNRCTLSLGAPGAHGVTAVATRVRENASIRLRHESTKNVWAVEVASEEGGHEPKVVYTRLDSLRPSTHVTTLDIHGAIAPDVASVVLGGLGAVAAAVGLLWIVVDRRRLRRMNDLHEATLLADGRVMVSTDDGVAPRSVSPKSGSFMPGKALVEDAPRSADFRTHAAPPVVVVASGSRADQVERHHVAAADVVATALLVALHLGTPIVAAALAGRLF